MYDYHLHSKLSFDGISDAKSIAIAAKSKGLKEICFTDHFDCNSEKELTHNLFTPEEQAAVYDNLIIPGITIKKGMEFGLTMWNQQYIEDFLSVRPLDFVIGSVHFVEGIDPYDYRYWENITVEEGFRKYLKTTLECLKVHDNFDVLGHINYVCKSPTSPTHEYLKYSDCTDIADEIMKILITKGKGMEINTSGVDRCGDFLPNIDYLKRFKELGGKIVTVGSDSHDAERVGQYTDKALEILKDIFGYVCTFKNRKPIFNKL